MFIPSGYAQANLTFAGAGLPYGAEITLGVDVAAYAGTPSTLAAEIAADWVATTMNTNLSSGVTFTGVEVKYGPNETGPSGTASASEAGAGSAQGPPTVCFLVTKNTALGGRRGKGRFYLPGVPEAAVDQAGLILSGTVTAIQAVMVSLHASAIADSRPYVLLHTSTEHFPDPITSFTVSGLAATQRRRMRR